MIIRGMNNFFGRHSRWIFGIFTIVIIISFMGIMTPGQYSGCFYGANGVAGTVFGEKITYAELTDEMNLMQIFAMFSGRQGEITPESALFQLAQIRAAEERGISVSDKAIADYIKMLFTDQAGTFNKEAFVSYMKYLEGQGMTQDDLQEAIRHSLMCMELGYEIQNSVIVTENEVKDFYRALNADVTLQVAEFKLADVKVDDQIDEAELQKFFEENRANYMIEANATALVVAFDDEQKAQRFAADTYDKALENNAETAAIFKAQAQDAKVTIIPCPKFTSSSEKVGSIKSPELVGEIFNTVSEVKITNAVPGELDGKKVYCVAFINGIADARYAELAEVKDQVIADYKSNLTVEKLQEETDNFYAELQGKSAEELAAAIKDSKKFVKTYTININNIGEDQFKGALWQVSRALGENEVSKAFPVWSETGIDGVAMVYLVKRTMPTIGEEFDAKKELYTSWYRQVKTEAVTNEFVGYLQEQCTIMIEQN